VQDKELYQQILRLQSVGRVCALTDFAGSVPSHVAASICGHTEEIAKEHYWTVGDRDLDRVMDKLTPELAQKLAAKLAPRDVSSVPDTSRSDSEPLGP
jgi:hypothetical protein